MPKTNVKVNLAGITIPAIIKSRVRKALEKTGHKDLMEEFIKKAAYGDYNHLIQTAMEYVEVL